MVQYLATFAATYSEQLGILSYILGAFSTIFASKALGRFPALTKSRGFYARLVAAIPAFAFIAATSYLFLTIAPHALISGVIRAIHYPITIPQIALAQGFLIGFLPMMVTDLYRSGYSITDPWFYAPSFVRAVVMQHRLSTEANKQDSTLSKIPEAPPSESPQPDKAEQTQPAKTPSAASGCLSALPAAIVILLSWYAGTLITILLLSQYVFAVLRWFGGHAPSFEILAIVAAVLTAVFWVWYADALSLRSNWSLAGCMVFYLLGIVVLPYFVGEAAMVVYIALNVGWLLFIGYLVASWVSDVIVPVIRIGADHLSTRALLALFAIPGAIAAAIQAAQFVLGNPNLLNLLPH